MNIHGCAFCEIVAGHRPADIIESWPDAVAFPPLAPVASGHVLVVSREHVADVTDDPSVAAAVMRRASQIAKKPCNIITSAGEAAMQTVFHLHLHVVPRRPGDGLSLPWS